MKLYAGIDLHSSNNYLGIVDENGDHAFNKRLSNRIEDILMALTPFKENIESVAVESTYNWYWLVDELKEHGYNVLLANPAAVKQYEGLKHTDDKHDSFWLANMMRLDILPTGYIYPKEERPIRDLFRKRLHLVQQRTSTILSLQGVFSRNTGRKISVNELKKLRPEDAHDLFDHPQLIMSAKSSIEVIRFLTEQIRKIEKEVLNHVHLREEFQCLLTTPGIGKILALTIMLEVGKIDRFPTDAQYSSYCRCVKSERLSNGKSKGKGNSKNGNKYLAWAYVEAANFVIRYCPEANRFYQKKKAKKNNVVAIKALSNKLAKATFHMMKEKTSFDITRIFSSAAKNQ